MDDQFLHQFRETPSQTFGEGLYEQLKHLEQEETMTTVWPVTPQLEARRPTVRRQRQPFITLAAALVAVVLLGVIMHYSGQSTPSLVSTPPPPLRELPMITRENAGQLVEIKRLGNGSLDQPVWSPDGQTLAVAGARGVWLFQAANLEAPPRLFETHGGSGGAVPSVDYSPDGRLIAASDGNAIRVWNAQTGEVMALLGGGHTNAVTTLAFSPDSQFIASGSGDWVVNQPDYSVWLWDLATGQGQVLGEGGNVARTVTFSPDGQQIGADFADNTAYVWDIQTGELQYTLYRANNGGSGLVFSPDGKLLALAEERGIVLRDIRTGKRIAYAKVSGDLPPFVSDITFTPDGKRLIFSVYNYGILVWDISSRQYINIPQLTQVEDIKAMSLNPAGNWLTMVGTDGVLRLWDWTTGEELAKVYGYIGPIFGLILDGTQASYGRETITEVRDLDTGKLLPQDASIQFNWQTPALSSDDNRQAYSFSVISPDETIKATVYDLLEPDKPSFVQIEDTVTGQIIQTIEHSSDNLISGAAFTVDGSLLATSLDGRLYLWDVATGERLFTSEPSEVFAAVAFDAEGHYIVTGGADGLVRVWGVLPE
ncbi:MAG TPA: WD40 repeat domain-containing protein [Phototrophicaceae bacterium]|nr:WD40 repeat domain-containing protein [Phototrophicaceae bacterium]